ncbi:MAG: MFS transporter [Thiolinea sp.]
MAWLAALLTLALLWAFVRHCRVTPQPLVNLRVIWDNRLFSRSLLAAICLYAGNYGLLFLLGLYLQYNQGMTPGQAGQMLMLQALMMALLTPISGRLSDRLQPQWLTTAGCLVLALGLVLMLTVNASTPLWRIGLGLMLLGLGFACSRHPTAVRQWVRFRKTNWALLPPCSVWRGWSGRCWVRWWSPCCWRC